MGAISLTGLLCLSLVGMLPWAIFVPVAALHIIICHRYFYMQWLPERSFTIIMLAIFAVEGLRLYVFGREILVDVLRDLIVLTGLTRFILRKTPREMYQIMGIALTECILSTIFTDSPTFLIGLLVMAALIPMALYQLDSLEFATNESPPARDHWLKVWLGIIALSAVLFYIIPRPAHTIINFSLAQQTRTGFSEEVSLNQESRISEDRSVAMRIIWNQAPERFYLAGARLEQATPEGFIKAEKTMTQFEKRNRYSDTLTIYPSGIYSKNVFAPFSLSDVSGRHVVSQGTNTYFMGEIPPVYTVWVERQPPHEPPGSLDYPSELEPTASLGRELAGNGSAKTKAERLANHLMQNCSYTLDALNVPEGESPINWFTTQGKRGSCEHFAAGLAIMLRGADIPARVVSGFVVQEFNEDYFIVRSSGAHAWVEYHDAGRWHTIDATPRSSEPAIRRSNIIDRLRFSWARWVIEYSLKDQINLAGYLSYTAPRELKELDRRYAGLLLILPLLVIIYRLIRHQRISPYEKVMKALGGLKLEGSHKDHLTTVREQRPEIAAEFEKYQQRYLGWRFGGRQVDIDGLTKEIIRKI